MNRLLPVKEIKKSDCKNLEYFFTDIDDTITENGLLPGYSYNSLWELYNNNIKVIPVTGRPAGWCDHIARMWPVEAVIGENGAFYFSYNRKLKNMERKYFSSKEQLEVNKRKLLKIKTRVLAEVPGVSISADQDYRIADLAVDFCEDVEHPGREAVQSICRIASEEGALYKISSIHVNCWFGEFNKVECVKKYLQENTNDYRDSFNKAFFIGDSPNDEPIFKQIKNSIGVANLNDFKNELKHLPLYITDNRSACGFTEAVDVIIKKKKS